MLAGGIYSDFRVATFFFFSLLALQRPTYNLVYSERKRQLNFEGLGLRSATIYGRALRPARPFECVRDAFGRRLAAPFSI